MREIFCLTESEFPKIYRQLPKIAYRFQKSSEYRQRFPTTSEDFPMTSKDKRRCREIFDDFKTGPAMVSKGFPTNLERC